MNSTRVNLLVLFCTFGAALLAMAVRHRLPAQHTEADSKDVVKLVLGLIATLTALVLSLLISSGYSAYTGQATELQQLAVHVYEIDRLLAHFGPAAATQRTDLKRLVSADVARIWPEDGAGKVNYAPLSAQREAEGLYYRIAGLQPIDDEQRLSQSRALELFSSVGETRRLLVEQTHGGLSLPFMIVLLSWLTILFFGFGLYARFNATVIVALFVGSLSVSGAIFLILQMNNPYGGCMQLSSAPLRAAVAQMGY